MSTSTEPRADSTGTAPTDFEAIVVGAGFGGLRMLHELRELGISARVLEAGSDVGGTWYWNRYPGARTDSESWAYIVNFSQDLKAEWDWQERFPSQPEVLSYLQHVADRFDMRREFGTRVAGARYDDAGNRWTITTEAGEEFTSTYFIPATGVLSHAQRPPFPGLESFRGEYYETARWPKEQVDLTGKRVAVVGTGASGVQVIPIVARAAEHVTVFQRTPNYVMPGRNYTLSDEQRQAIRRDYDRIWENTRKHVFGFDMAPAGRVAGDLNPDERRRFLERAWETGGFYFVFDAFDDLLVNDDANHAAAEFIRNKIRTIVDDPATAELLCPKRYPFLGKRPPVGHLYYETFNRDNVALVDVHDDPIAEVTPTGLRTASGTEYPVDMIVFATGFDALTGALSRIDIRGRGGVGLREKWSDGGRTHLGICVDGFPNLFMICGPQSPFANIPVAAEGVVEWIGAAIEHLRTGDLATIEATSDAVRDWDRHIDELFHATVLPQCPNSWWLGANVPGKAPTVLFYFGGYGAYRKECISVAEQGYPGFTFATARD
jgi:cyclohexanone monooxygenase